MCMYRACMCVLVLSSLVTGTYFLSFSLRSLNQQCKEKKEEVLEENVERQPHMYTNLPIRDEHKT